MVWEVFFSQAFFVFVNSMVIVKKWWIIGMFWLTIKINIKEMQLLP
ncbi:hypothetical protein [Bacillus weihaiensis]|nr:hypothetical protein [Bacillus weihaiensis]